MKRLNWFSPSREIIHFDDNDCSALEISQTFANASISNSSRRRVGKTRGESKMFRGKDADLKLSRQKAKNGLSQQTANEITKFNVSSECLLRI